MAAQPYNNGKAILQHFKTTFMAANAGSFRRQTCNHFKLLGKHLLQLATSLIAYSSKPLSRR